MSKAGNVRYVRIMLLTFEGGMEICRKLIEDKLTKPTTGTTDLNALLLNEKKQLENMKDRRQITKIQYNVLFKPNPRKSGEFKTDLKEWDLSLLIKMTEVLFEHALSVQEQKYLNELLRIRNEVVCHTSRTGLEESDYKAHLRQLEECLKGLASAIDMKTEREINELVHKFSTESIDIQSSITKVNWLCRNDVVMEDVLERLELLFLSVDDIDKKLGKLDKLDRLDECVMVASFEEDIGDTHLATVGKWYIRGVRRYKTSEDADVVVNIHRWFIGEISGKEAIMNINKQKLNVGGAIFGWATGSVFLSVGRVGRVGYFLGCVAGAVVGLFAAYLTDRHLKDNSQEFFGHSGSERSDKAYEFLRVSKNASNAEINSSYERLGRLYDPKNGGKEKDWTKLQFYMAIIREDRGADN